MERDSVLNLDPWLLQMRLSNVISIVICLFKFLSYNLKSIFENMFYLKAYLRLLENICEKWNNQHLSICVWLFSCYYNEQNIIDPKYDYFFLRQKPEYVLWENLRSISAVGTVNEVTLTNMLLLIAWIKSKSLFPLRVALWAYTQNRYSTRTPTGVFVCTHLKATLSIYLGSWVLGWREEPQQSLPSRGSHPGEEERQHTNG